MKPGLLRRVLYRLGLDASGWVDCPEHGWTFDPLPHGYHRGLCYHHCQTEGCNYYVDYL